MNKTAETGYDILMRLIGEHGFIELIGRLDDDQESAELLAKSVERLSDQFNLSSQEEVALNRLTNMVRVGGHWDGAMLRNGIFKIADLMGIKLPSGMFASTKQAYLLPKLPGDPIRVLRMFTPDGLRKKHVRLDEGMEGTFVKMEVVGMPSAELRDQMGLGAYDTPRYIANFPAGPVYLAESDFQFKYVERPTGERNLLKAPATGATPDEKQERRQEIQNLHRIEQRYAMNSQARLAELRQQRTANVPSVGGRKTTASGVLVPSIGQGKVIYRALYKGREIEVSADGAIQAQAVAADYFHASHDTDVQVDLVGVNASHARTPAATSKSRALDILETWALHTGGEYSRRIMQVYKALDRGEMSPPVADLFRKILKAGRDALREVQEQVVGEVAHFYRLRVTATQGVSVMSSLYDAIRRVASIHPETRVHLVPLIRQFASGNVTACTCPDGGKAAAEGDELMGGRTWGNPDPRATPDDALPYHKHEDSPPAGTDGSAQRKKYNDWFRDNVCPTHKTNCGAPWLAK